MSKKVKVCIGIISYFPDDWDLKVKRVERLNRLVKKCDILFNVPIMIIAQNWKDVSLQEGTTHQPMYIYNYQNGLGINNARKELRKKFLESEFDYLVMFDDDCDLGGKIEDGRNYIAQLQKHPGMFCPSKTSILKLFAISKEMYKLVDFPDGGADDKDPSMRYFEDMYIENSLRHVYPNKLYIPRFGTLVEVSDNAYDDFSTGWHYVYDPDSEGNVWERRNTGDLTRGLIIQATKETLKNPALLKRGVTMDLGSYNKAYGIKNIAIPPDYFKKKAK